MHKTHPALITGLPRPQKSRLTIWAIATVLLLLLRQFGLACATASRTSSCPKALAEELEKLVGQKKLDAVIAIDDAGNAGIKGLMVEGNRVYEEPLL